MMLAVGVFMYASYQAEDIFNLLTGFFYHSWISDFINAVSASTEMIIFFFHLNVVDYVDF